MVDITLNGRSRHLVIPEGRYDKLPCPFVPGDADEHGAVIAAGIMSPAECPLGSGLRGSAVAGDIWQPDGTRVELADASIVGRGYAVSDQRRGLTPAASIPILPSGPAYRTRSACWRPSQYDGNGAAHN